MKKVLSFAFFTMFAAGIQAQEVHGVGGFYNWTAQQIKADGIATTDGNGTKLAKWKSSLNYEGDYVKMVMGIGNTTYNTTKGGFQCRVGLKFTESAAGAGILTIPKKAYAKDAEGNVTDSTLYHVFAFKLSMPVNAENLSTYGAYIEPEWRWYNPTTGKAEKLPYDGSDNNGRYRFVTSFPGKKLSDGSDSVAFKWRAHNANKDTTICFYKSGDKYANVVVIADLTAHDNGKTNALELALDTTDIKLAGFSFGMVDAFADTVKYDQTTTDNTAVKYVTENDTVKWTFGSDGKTKMYGRVKNYDELPTYYFKWFRTFKSLADAKAFAEQNDGDGPDYNPYRDVLGTYIYKAQNLQSSYSAADASSLSALSNAIVAAKAVYGNTGSTQAEYESQQLELAKADSTFLATISLKFKSNYNKITDASGSNGIVLSPNEGTYGTYKGKAVIVDAADNASGFTFVEAGTINGQQAYKLITAEGTVVQASDASHTLVLVDESQVTASNPALFVFANRTGADSLCDMKVGNYYYYVDSEGAIKTITEIPSSSLDEMAPYLWSVSKTTYTPEGGKTAFAGWEFNNAAADDGSGLSADETVSVEGWRMQRWRMWSRVTEETAPGGEKCMVLKAVPTYYEYNDVSKATAESTAYPVGVSARREGGVFTNAYDRDPLNNVRDSSEIIYLDSYTSPYFAIKMVGTNGSSFESLSFFVKKGVDEPALTLSNLAGKKGDVYYWNLVDCGIPVGTKGYSAQFLSTTGVADANARFYIDWMRTYNSIENIPDTVFDVKTGISNNTEQSQALVFTNGKNIVVDGNGSVMIFDAAGKFIAAGEQVGQKRYAVSSGMYIVSIKDEKRITVKKILVK